MKKIAVIPARYASTRLHAKLMQDLGGKTVILTTYLSVLNTNLFDDVIVVTDSEIILNEIISNKGRAFLSFKNHDSGSDRIAEIVEDINCDIVVNVQGDEPFIDKKSLQILLNVFDNDPHKNIDLASLMHQITNENEVIDPNNVKVVTDQNNFALYFSRSVIPYVRESTVNVKFMKHIGIYAYRKQALIDFSHLSMQSLEASEKLEQLRYLEYGKRIKMVETKYSGIGIDTIEDLEKARKLFEILRFRF